MRNLYTNHGLVLMRIWLNPDATLADIASDIGIRDRAVHLIVQDLVREGFMEKRKEGRRNRYEVKIDRALDYQPLRGISIRDQIVALASMLGMSRPEERAASSSAAPVARSGSPDVSNAAR